MHRTATEITTVLSSNNNLNTRVATPQKQKQLDTQTELTNAVVAQIFLLFAKADPDHQSDVFANINFLLESHPEAYLRVFNQLFKLVTSEFITNKEELGNLASVKLLKEVIVHIISSYPSRIETLAQALVSPHSDIIRVITLKKLFSILNLSKFQALLITLAVENCLASSSVTATFKTFVTSQIPPIYLENLDCVAKFTAKVCNTPVSELKKQIEGISFVLSLLLKSTVFSLPQKFVIVSQVSGHLKESDGKSDKVISELTRITSKYLKSVSKMKFIDGIKMVGADKLLPDKVLETMLTNLPATGVTGAFTLLLTETLLPGLQGICGSNPERPTSLTPSSIPEASARGSQLWSLLKKQKNQPDWDRTFSGIIDAFKNPLHKSDKPHITTASLSEFLSSIQSPKLIDSFLCKVYDSDSIELMKQIIIQLHLLDPDAGAIDLLSLDLEPIISTEKNTKGSILYFKNVSMLEVRLVALIQQQDMNDSEVTQVFNSDYKAAPELIVFGCLDVLQKSPGAPEGKVICNVMQNFIISLLDAGSQYIKLIFTEYEKINSSGLGKLLVKYYESRNNNSETINKIAEWTTSLKNDTVIMSILSNSSDFPEAFTIAVIFSQYGWKKFENFVSTQLDRNIKVVAVTIINFMEKQATIEYESAQQGHALTKSLNLQTVHLLMNSLSQRKLPTDLVDKFRNLQALCLQAYPRLINFGQGHDEAILSNSATNTFSVDVEKEMKSYYQKMYNKEIEIKDVIHMLRKLKDSDDPHDQDVFACMIHSLLDEYRFFPEYPVDALATTSVLFGNTIYFHLIEGSALSIALHYILQSARESPQSKMFKFAIQALFSFMKRLSEFPKFCNMLCQVPALKTQPQLYEACQASAQGKQVESPDTKDTTSSRKKTPPSFIKSKFLSIHPIDIIPGAPEQSEPSSEVSDRILFLVNNIAEANVDSRVKELKKKLLKPKNCSWFAEYIVTQRAEVEPNNQDLYGSIVAEFGSPLLAAFMLYFTFKEIVLLLNKIYGDDKETTEPLSSKDKMHLKNLGLWLGKITLARDQPILRKHISFKHLLMEAYDCEKFVDILPFVTRVLEACNKSKVFKLPNPWLLGIMEELKEYYDVADLPLNSKFEVEVLCQKLSIDLGKIQASGSLKNHKPGELINYLRNQTVLIKMARLSLKDREVSPPGIASPAGLGFQSQRNQLALLQQRERMILAARQQKLFKQQQQQQQLQQQQQQQKLQQLLYLDHLSGNTVFVTHPDLKKLFQMALMKSILEVLTPVMDRTVSVSLVAAKTLILKDFSLELDEVKFRKAYINTIRHLSGALSLASCMDLLRESIQINTRQLLQSLMHYLDPEIIKQLPQAIDDNISTATSVIQKLAMRRAASDMDEMMLPALALRRQFKATRPNQPFCDMQNFSRYAISLPDPLGIQPGGISDKQFAVYEKLGGGSEPIPQPTPQQPAIIPNANDTKPGAMNSSLTDTPGTPSAALNLPKSVEMQKVLERSILIIQQLLDGILKSTAQLQAEEAEKNDENKHSSKGNVNNQNENLGGDNNTKVIRIADLTADSPIKTYMAQVLQILARINHVEACMKCSQMCMNALFGNSNSLSPLGIECFIFLLGKACEMSSVVAKFVSGWLIGVDDKRKYNKDVLEALVRAGMISLADLDLMLAKKIDKEIAIESTGKKNKESSVSKKLEGSQTEPILNFACDIIEDLVIKKPIALRSDFVNTFESLEKTEKSDKVNSLLKLSSSSVPISSLRDYFAYLFAEWVKLYKFSHDSSKLEVRFINQLFDEGIFNKPDRMVMFFTTATEMAATAFVKESDASKRSAIDAYTSVDALAKLIVVLILIQEDASDKNKSKVEFLRSILSVILLTFAYDHECSGANFNERPYFRIFSTLLCEWAAVRQSHFISFVSNEAEAHRLEQFSYQFYNTLAEYFLSLQPAAFPGFTFAWMCLISHRMFMPMLLKHGAESHSKKESWDRASALLIALLRFQSGYVSGKSIPEAITVVYKGTLRILLVILHDFPEFLAEYASELVGSMSLTFAQLRNIVLSAVPDGIKVPDPYEPDLNIESLHEITSAPVVATHPGNMLAHHGIKKAVDDYLRIPSESLVDQIEQGLKLEETVQESGIGYSETNFNIRLVNSLILYIGMSAVEDGSNEYDPKSSQSVIVSSLMKNGSVELQYQILEAVANNLRYPNSHTHWFSDMILDFFESKTLWNNQDNIQQLIVRVLLERFICNKPHPWGLVITFTKILNNTDYEFSKLPFTKGIPEYEMLFKTLSHQIRGKA